MKTSARTMALGLSMRGHGYNDSAWMHPEADLSGPSRFDYYLDLVTTAERGLLDLVFLADVMYFPLSDVPVGALGRRGDGASLEPITLLAALAPRTRHIGLVATASTTFYEPYLLARLFGSLDLLSGGRAGWNVVTSTDDEEARNFGADRLVAKEVRYERAGEFVDVVTGLWESFEPNAFCPNRDTGQYFSPAAVHPLDHRGRHFSVKGPLNVARSPQGRPIIVQAGASEEGQELAARTADIVYALQNDIAKSRAFCAGLKDRMAKYGRRREDLRVMPGLMPIVAASEDAARAKFESLKRLVDPLVGLEYLANYFGDLSGYPLDGPVPDLRDDQQLPSRSRYLLHLARDRNYSIRELYENVCASNGHHTVVGTAREIVDLMETWFVEGAADGFNILPAVSPGSVRDFVDHVIPELQRRNLFRTAYEGRTLRDNLGLNF